MRWRATKHARLSVLSDVSATAAKSHRPLIGASHFFLATFVLLRASVHGGETADGVGRP